MQIYFGVIYVTKRHWKILSFNFELNLIQFSINIVSVCHLL